MNTQRWGAIAAFVFAAAMIAAPWIYLTNNPNGPLALYVYALADLLYGPIFAACLVGVMTVIKEQIGDKASRRMTFALNAAWLAALMMVATAIARSGNRDYFFVRHPQSVSTDIFLVVQGTLATGYHFLGWSLLLMGSAVWTSGVFPRPLAALALIAGALSFFTYLVPDPRDFGPAMLAAIWAIWQGVILWRRGSGAMPELAKDPQAA